MTARKLNVLSIVFVLGLTAVFVWGFALPGVRNLHELQDKATTELQVVEQERRELGDVSRLYASILELNEEVSSFEKRLPTDRMLGDFLSELSHCIASANIDDFAIQPKQELRLDEARLPAELTPAAGTIVLPVNVSFEGSFVEVCNLLDGIEKLDRLAHIEHVDIVNSEERPGHAMAAVVVHAYHRPSENTP